MHSNLAINLLDWSLAQHRDGLRSSKRGFEAVSSQDPLHDLGLVGKLNKVLPTQRNDFEYDGGVSVRRRNSTTMVVPSG